MEDSIVACPDLDSALMGDFLGRGAPGWRKTPGLRVFMQGWVGSAGMGGKKMVLVTGRSLILGDLPLMFKSNDWLSYQNIFYLKYSVQF